MFIILGIIVSLVLMLMEYTGNIQIGFWWCFSPIIIGAILQFIIPTTGLGLLDDFLEGLVSFFD